MKFRDCFSIKRTPLVAFIIILCMSLSLFLSIDWLWPEFMGSSNLGNGLYLLEWDGGPIVVKGTNIHGKICYGGEYIIPAYNCRYDSVGNINEYIIKEKHNDKFILVKDTVLTPAGYKYYLIEKNFPTGCSTEIIKNKYIVTFSDSIQFFNYVHSRNVDIEWIYGNKSCTRNERLKERMTRLRKKTENVSVTGNG